RLFVVALLALGAAACGSNDSQRSASQTIMPNVTGQQLDVAESNIQHAGIDPAKVKIVGGGTFGVNAKSNWQVCNQVPAPGEVLSSEPQLQVARTCETGETTTTTVPTTTSPTTSQPAPPTTANATADASAMEQAFLMHLANNGIESISDM